MKKALSLLLVFVMLIAAAPMAVNAADTDAADSGAALSAVLSPEHNFVEKQGGSYPTTYTVHANGGTAPYSYDWQTRYFLGKWTSTGNAESTHTDTDSGRITSFLRCKVTDKDGTVAYAYADTKRRIEITKQPVGGTLDYTAGVGFHFDLNAAASYGVSPIRYQWRRDGMNISGATSAAYTATRSGNYTFVAYDANGDMAISDTVLVDNMEPTTTLAMPDAYWDGTTVRWKEVDGANGYVFVINSCVPDGYHNTVMQNHCRIMRKGSSVDVYRYSGATTVTLPVTYSESTGYAVDCKSIIRAASDIYNFYVTAHEFGENLGGPSKQISPTYVSSYMYGESLQGGAKVARLQQVNVTVNEPYAGKRVSTDIAIDEDRVILKTDASAPDGLAITESGRTMSLRDCFSEGKEYQYKIGLEQKIIDGIRYVPDNGTQIYINGVEAETRTGIMFVPSGHVTASVTFSCQPRSTYHVTFDANGGTGDMGYYPVEQGGSFTLPDCYFTAPGNQIFAGWQDENNDLHQAGDTVTVDHDLRFTAMWKDDNDNTLSGTVTSFLNESDGATVRIIKRNDSSTFFSRTVYGNNAAFSISDVPEGLYTLTVSKKNHVTRTMNAIVSGNVSGVAVKINPIGDVTGDGQVTTLDFARANAHAKGAMLLTGYELKCGDVVGSDGTVTTLDAARINAHAKGAVKLW